MPEYCHWTVDMWAPANNPDTGEAEAGYALAQANIPCDFQALPSEMYLRRDMDVSGDMLRIYMNDVVTGGISDRAIFYVKASEFAYEAPTGSYWIVAKPALFYPIPECLAHWEVMVEKAENVPGEITETYP